MAKQKHNRERMMVSVPRWVVEHFAALGAERLTSRELEAGRCLERALLDRGIGPGSERSEAERKDSD